MLQYKKPLKACKKKKNVFQMHRLSTKAEDDFIHFSSLCKQDDNHIVKQLKKDAKENKNPKTTGESD